MNNLKTFYENDKRFSEYVNKYCKEYGYSVEVALTHKLVHEVAEYYRKESK